jgi:hypothetical protein
MYNQHPSFQVDLELFGKNVDPNKSILTTPPEKLFDQPFAIRGINYYYFIIIIIFFFNI